MGFHVGSDDDSEGDDCFDGSVPRRLGDAEPSEPWQVWLQRLLDEQSADPSGLFILVIFLPVVVLYVSYRALKPPSYGRTLTIEEVRAMAASAVRTRKRRWPRHGRILD
ncbi:hypothetical protein PINS_up023525 [Pythium insidiosum]|nr:hypothetical protein PINS_up023525 [Pythium insidiosum]